VSCCIGISGFGSHWAGNSDGDSAGQLIIRFLRTWDAVGLIITSLGKVDEGGEIWLASWNSAEIMHNINSYAQENGGESIGDSNYVLFGVDKARVGTFFSHYKNVNLLARLIFFPGLVRFQFAQLTPLQKRFLHLACANSAGHNKS